MKRRAPPMRNSARPAAPVASSADDTPSLRLLPGDALFDVAAVVALYEAVSGRKPTAAEIAEVRAFLDQHRH